MNEKIKKASNLIEIKEKMSPLCFWWESPLKGFVEKHVFELLFLLQVDYDNTEFNLLFKQSNASSAFITTLAL